jgi:hypothetical protein
MRENKQKKKLAQNAETSKATPARQWHGNRKSRRTEMASLAS